MKAVIMVTGNMGKWAIAKDIFSNYNLVLEQAKIETPEIQSDDVEEVSAYSAEYAANILNAPVIKSDVGYYIKELGGFPGPFLKYVNKMLQPIDILRMMDGKKDRSIILKECLTYAEPGKKTVKFISEDRAIISLKPCGGGSTFDQIIILNGFTLPKGACSDQDNFEYFKNHLDIYHDAAKYLEGLDTNERK